MRYAILLFTLLAGCSSDTAPEKKAEEPKELSYEEKRELDESNKAIASRKAFEEDSAYYADRTIHMKRLTGKELSGGRTKVSYTPVNKAVEETKAEAKKMMRTADEMVSSVAATLSISPGGQIEIDVSRSAIAEADLGTFMVIIHDSTDTEIHRERLHDGVPGVAGNSFVNGQTVYLQQRVRPPFYIYLTGRLEKDAFKYLVTLK